MKKLLQLNTVANCGSTGRIAEGIGQLAIENGWESYMAFGRGNPSSQSNLIRIGNDWDMRFHVLESRIFDNHGFASRRATKKFIEEIDKINPDLIHLQNLHGYYIHIGLLFEYLKRIDKPIVWTLVDCWALTGHCVYFDEVGCNRWETGCYSCPQKSSYPASYLIDNSSRNYELKKRLFNLPTKMTVVVHSEWLHSKVKKSYMKEVPVELIYNGIDISRFKQKNGEALRNRLGINDKFVILGIANQWIKRAGLVDFIKLSNYLKDDEVIVLDGVSSKQEAMLPHNIIVHERSETVEQLAELYSSSDVYINPIHETNFPTTNLEAMACGTPVITYNVGGSPEGIDSKTGIVVAKGDIEGLVKSIAEIRENKKCNYSSFCIDKVKSEFNQLVQYKKYIAIFNAILGSN